MFAPWCPTCARRTLLGARRIESVERGPSGPRVVLRCHCDTLLVWSAASERDPGAPAPVPTGAVRRAVGDDVVGAGARPGGRAAAPYEGRPRPRT